jgi:uncharacterized coiled-coil protein SlyX
MGTKHPNNLVDNITKYGQLGGIALIAWLQTQFPSRAAFDELSKKLDSLQGQVTSLQSQVTQLNATQQKVSEISIKMNEFDARIRILEIQNAKSQTSSK